MEVDWFVSSSVPFFCPAKVERLLHADDLSDTQLVFMQASLKLNDIQLWKTSRQADGERVRH